MNFNDHSKLLGCHALLSASKHSWLNYDEDKLYRWAVKAEASKRGTELHAFAAQAIKFGIKLRDSNNTINQYVNDAIGYCMTPEQVLWYSNNCFGTADAISFRDNMLRIHDFKSGESPASMDQLSIYAALFCLEYNVKPRDIDIELRIYQTSSVNVYSPEPSDIERIMDKIVAFDKKIEEMRSEGVIS